MTDNKSYVLGVTCWEDDQSSWTVMSTKTCLEPDVRSKVIAYVKSLGFNTNNAVDENYEICGKLYGGSMPPYLMLNNAPVAYFNPYTYFSMGYNQKY